jgi:hypothetical protein
MLFNNVVLTHTIVPLGRSPNGALARNMLITSTGGTSIPLKHLSSHVRLHQHDCTLPEPEIGGR